jgi:CheY-like chemotaxis protein
MIGMQALTGALRTSFFGSQDSDGVGALALVVVDGPMQGGPWKVALRAQGFRVRLRYGGHEGLDAFEEECPALLVLDLWRAGMDALTFLKVIRAVHPETDVPAFVRSTPGGGLDPLLEAAGASAVLQEDPDGAALRGLLARHGLVDAVRDGALPPGTKVADRFVVDALIGQGATACVYRATDLELGEQVALKLLDCTASVPGAADRFRQEMRICRRLQHGHVVRTYEYGVWQGRPFFTMELLRGHTLRGFLRERRCRPVPIAVGIPLVVQACRGLAAAHDLGVVHRDIKPDNLFVVDGERTLKVMDFGIARSREQGGLTSTRGLVLGTPGYIAPERIAGGEASVASDVYSLGVVLFELFTGRAPFEGATVGALLERVVHQPAPDATSFNPLLPEELAGVIDACLAKDPALRPASTRELERRLTAAL